MTATDQQPTTVGARPTRSDIEGALAAAGKAHHEYELDYLGGERDPHWAGWYAAYALGRLGDFVSGTTLTRWLEAAPATDNWAGSTAVHVSRELDDEGSR